MLNTDILTVVCETSVAQISYNIKIKVDRENCDIVNSDCECPAGKGPQNESLVYRLICETSNIKRLNADLPPWRMQSRN